MSRVAQRVPRSSQLRISEATVWVTPSFVQLMQCAPTIVCDLLLPRRSTPLIAHVGRDDELHHMTLLSKLGAQLPALWFLPPLRPIFSQPVYLSSQHPPPLFRSRSLVQDCASARLSVLAAPPSVHCTTLTRLGTSSIPPAAYFLPRQGGWSTEGSAIVRTSNLESTMRLFLTDPRGWAVDVSRLVAVFASAHFVSRPR